MDGENVGAAKAENQKHFDGPGADAADGDEALDEFFVGERMRLLECRHDALKGLAREILHGQDFCARETGFAELGLGELEDLFRGGRPAVSAEGFDAAENGSGGFPGDGLVGDGFEKSFVRGLEMVGVGLEGGGVGDDLGELFVAGAEMLHRLLEVEGRNTDGLGSVFEHG